MLGCAGRTRPKGNRISLRRIIGSSSLLAIYLLIVAAPVLGPIAHAVDHLREQAPPGAHHAAEHHHPHHHQHHDLSDHAHAPMVLALLGVEPGVDLAGGDSDPVRLVIVNIPNHLGVPTTGELAPAAPAGRLSAAREPGPGDLARPPLTPPPRPACS